MNTMNHMLFIERIPEEGKESKRKYLWQEKKKASKLDHGDFFESEGITLTSKNAIR